MNSCEECPYRDGVLSAFTYQNPDTPFEQLGFIKVQRDGWKNEWDEENTKYIKVRTGYEEWQIDVWLDTPAEYHKFITNLRNNGLQIMSYTSNTTRIRPLNKSQFLIRK